MFIKNININRLPMSIEESCTLFFTASSLNSSKKTYYINLYKNIKQIEK